MPANSTFLLDPATFTSVVLMSSMPKVKFGTQDEIEVNAAGQKKYTLEVAVSYPPPAPGMKGGSEVITVTIAGDRDPAEGITYPAPVQLEGVRMGVSQVEMRNGRPTGGRPYFMATGVKSAVTAFRKSDAA